VLAHLLSKPRKLIISILIGNMFVNVLASTITSSLSLRLFGGKGLAISICAMTFLILTFGEIAPKVIAIRNSEKIALLIGPVIKLFSKLIFPIRQALQSIVETITPAISGRIKDGKQALTEEELAKAVEMGRREGVLDRDEENMIKSVFKFGDKTAADVLIPLKRLAAIDIATPINTIRSIITDKELSRIPVFSDRLDNIVGILYAKDLFVASRKGEIRLREILREPFYITLDIRLDDLLKKFRAHRIHMALVKGRDGRLIGLVTLQDLLEEIVGQIKDIKG